MGVLGATEWGRAVGGVGDGVSPPHRPPLPAPRATFSPPRSTRGSPVHVHTTRSTLACTSLPTFRRDIQIHGTTHARHPAPFPIRLRARRPRALLHFTIASLPRTRLPGQCAWRVHLSRVPRLRPPTRPATLLPCYPATSSYPDTHWHHQPRHSNPRSGAAWWIPNL